MAASIMQQEKVCYLTGRTDNLHKHHIYPGTGYRRNSEKYGCWVWLTGAWHNQSSHGVHFNPELDQRLKKECQMEFEKTHSRAKFIALFGRSYL